MEAGKYFLQRENSWSEFTDPNAMYLNGSSPLILSSLLSIFPIQIGILILRITNILATLAISFQIGRRSPQLPVPAIYILILLIFPFRSAMEYGQFTILFTFLAFILLQNILSKGPDSLLAVISLALIVDFKPHIFMGLVVLILLKKRFNLVFKAFTVWISIQLIVGFWTHTIPFFEWMLAIRRRNSFVSQGEDNLSLVTHFFSSEFILAVVFSIIVIFSLWWRFRISGRSSFEYFEILSVSLILSPLLHPTDMLLLALILLSQVKFSKLHVLLIGIFLVWSPLLSGILFTITVISVMFFLLALSNTSLGTFWYLTLLTPYLVYICALRIGIDEVSVRHFLQQSILFLIAFQSLRINRNGLVRF